MNLSPKTAPVKIYWMSMLGHECPWGLKASALLKDKNIPFEDIRLTTKAEVEEFKALHQVKTTPQIFWGETRIGGYTDLAAYLEVQAQATEYPYTPVIALFSTAGLMTLATSLGFTGFMGIALSMLASFKLMDVDAFSKSFAKYDLITKRYQPYGKIYPFLELLIGLGILSGLAPVMTGIGSLVVGVSGAASVVKAAYLDKMALNCACIGGNSKAPLGIVSFTENVMMAVMGIMLLIAPVELPGNNAERLPLPLAPEPQHLAWLNR